MIDVQLCTGAYGTWTELEAWYWFAGDAHPRRFALAVDGHARVRFGDLVSRDVQESRQVTWWNNHGERRPGKLLLVSEFEELPALPA